ncbi:hypothetical protein [Methylocystis echinoides]|uniref:Uncharacterized protein n=1 Tax=Methylocystis echinoides TaxID=29468 RepID=A0A9W6GQM5_9HYPH|nr:hypothetical protein [Methylocystis echinoides]GLI91111.1 hypothetical protein LMG27198_01030 [Methylocystis echinoides]
MTTSRAKPTRNAVVSKTSRDGILFQPPALIQGEDRDSYDRLAAQIRAAVAPADALEEIWAEDVITLVWELQRLRRLKAKYLHAAAPDGLERALRPLVQNFLERGGYVEGWAKRDPESVKAVDAILNSAGLDQDHLAAHTLAAKIEVFEKLDRLIAATEGRRNAALRELQRHRESLAQRFRQALPQIEDGEFCDVSEAME